VPDALAQSTLKNFPVPRADIQAILDVLGRRKVMNRGGEELRIDLTATELCNARLTGACLDGAIFDRACLIGAVLNSARLCEARFFDADLQLTELQYTNLSRADLEDANLADARFRAAVLDGANLHGTNLKGASIKSSSFRSADFIFAHLYGTRLSGAILDGADLRYAIGLTLDQLKDARIFPTTRLPVEFRDLVPGAESGDEEDSEDWAVPSRHIFRKILEPSTFSDEVEDG
jgi:uncharacterized protein YjbI with pentapeptide repeats